MEKEILKNDVKKSHHLQFKSSLVSIIDNTFKVSWLVIILIVTNFAIIVSKINEFNEKINIKLNVSTNIFIIILLAMFIFGSFIYYIIKWNIFKIELDEKKITVYKNIVIKDRYVFLLKNISGYVIEQNILDKIFRVYRFKIYTERIYNTKLDTEFVVKKEIAEKINDIVLNEISNVKMNRKDYDKVSNFDINLKLKSIFVHSILNISLKNSFIILNVILLIFTMISKGTIVKEITTNLLGLLITILTIVFPILYSLIISIFKFYGYKLKKLEDFLVVEYGWFTTKKYFIPIHKIKGIIIKETLISRIFNYNMLQVICSGIANKNGELNFLLPMINKNRLNKILKLILLNINVNLDSKPKKQADFSITIFMILFTVISLIIIPTLMFFRINTIYILIYMLVSSLMIIIFYFFKRVNVEEKYILISTGVFIKKVSLILYDSIKYIKISEGLISSIFNIKVLSVYITSNVINLKHILGYVTNNTLNKVKKYIYYN